MQCDGVDVGITEATFVAKVEAGEAGTGLEKALQQPLTEIITAVQSETGQIRKEGSRRAGEDWNRRRKGQNRKVVTPKSWRPAPAVQHYRFQGLGRAVYHQDPQVRAFLCQECSFGNLAKIIIATKIICKNVGTTLDRNSRRTLSINHPVRAYDTSKFGYWRRILNPSLIILIYLQWGQKKTHRSRKKRPYSTACHS